MSDITIEGGGHSQLSEESLHNAKTSRLTQEKQSEAFTTAAPITASPPSNPLDPTTEKLSLTDKSVANSESVANSSLISTVASSNASDDTAVNSSNVHYAKTSKQRGSSNSLVKSTGGGIRVSGQKIEMPQLNNYFDHSAYLKKHEHGFR